MCTESTFPAMHDIIIIVYHLINHSKPFPKAEVISLELLVLLLIKSTSLLGQDVKVDIVMESLFQTT